MKLVIAGATGFVGKEVLLQALASPVITSIVTLGRRSFEISIPETSKSKLTSIILEDLEQYSPAVKEQIANADACIWIIAVALTKSFSTPFDEVKKVTRDYTLAGIEALTDENKTGKLLKFIYFSGVAVSRDLNEEFRGPKEIEAYSKLRGKLEVELVEYTAKNKDRVELCCVRPGYIVGDRGEGYVPPQLPVWMPTIKVEECVAAVLNQCIRGIEKDPLGNDDMRRIGQEFLGK